MGFGAGWAQGAQGAQGILGAWKMRDELKTYPQLLQQQLAQQTAQSGIMQNTLNYAPQTSQAGINLTNAQAQDAAANAGYQNTEAGKNQFLLDNPGLMIPGVGGNIAGIATAQKYLPSAFGMAAPNGAPVTSGASTTGQILPPSNPNQGGLAALNNGSSVPPPSLFPPNMGIQPAGSNMSAGNGMGMNPNLPIMLQRLAMANNGGMQQPAAPMPIQQPAGMSAPPPVVQNAMGQNPLQQAAQQGNGQMFGGNPLANQALAAAFAPMNKDLALTNYYNARGAQLQGQLQAGKNPMMGSMMSGAGGTYVDPTTGQVTSTDTSAQTTRDQRTVAGLKNAQQYLGNVVQQMPQFVTGTGKLQNEVKGFANNWLGTQYSDPSKYAAAESSLSAAAEGILNGFGLNSTGENVKFAYNIMAPVKGESPFWYQNRVMNQLSDFSDQVHRAEDRLGQGTNITPQQESQIYSNAANMVMSDPTAATKVFIPNFKSTADFNKWYQGIPSEAQGQVSAQLSAQGANNAPQNAQSSPTAPAQVTFKPTGNTSATVTIQGSDGKQWNIPAKNLQAALQRGAKQVQ